MGMLEILLQAIRRPRSKVWWIAPTYRMGKRVFFRPFVRLLRGSGLLDGEPNWTELRLRLWDGTEVSCMSAEHPDRMRGDALDLAIHDEYQDQGMHIFDEIIEPMLLERDGRVRFYGTPKGQSNALWEAYVRAESEPDWRSYRLTSADAGIVPRWKVERLRARAEARGPTSLKIFRREYEADFLSFRGQVFPTWDPTASRVPLPTTWARCVVGMDWGYSDTHAGVAIVAVNDDGRPRRGCWTVVEEVHEFGVPIEAGWVPRLRRLHERWGFRVVWAPDDRPDGIDALRRASEGGKLWQTRPVKRNIDARIAAMADVIETQRLCIARGAAQVLERQLGSYQWREDQRGRLTARPVKADDDSVDACGALLYGEAGRKLPLHKAA